MTYRAMGDDGKYVYSKFLSNLVDEYEYIEMFEHDLWHRVHVKLYASGNHLERTAIETYTINLDDFSEEIFHEMEAISEGTKSHQCDIKAIDKKSAVKKIIGSLELFIYNQLNITQ